MAGSMNRATIIGHLGADPEIRSLNSGGKVANFRVATSETWKDKQGEKKESTQWHSCVVWNENLINGVIEKYVKKGSRVLVEGQLQTRKWEKDGVERFTTEIVLSGFNGVILLLDGKKDGGGQNENSQRAGNSSGSVDYAKDLDDEIPF